MGILIFSVGFPEAYITAFQALFWIGGISPTDKASNAKKTVLIHAGARFSLLSLFSPLSSLSLLSLLIEQLIKKKIVG